MMKLRISILWVFFALLVSPAMLALKAQLVDNGARLLDQFGVLPNGDMRARLDLLLTEISNNPNSSAIIYTRGTPDQIAVRTRYWKNQIVFRQFDASRIKFISGRNVGYLQTDMWLVPAGAAPPEIKPEAWIAAEFGAVTVTAGKRRIASFFADKKKACSDQVYIINYGSPKQIGQREMWFRNTRISCGYDGNRITLVNGGLGPVRTVMWLVPPGADNPTP